MRLGKDKLTVAAINATLYGILVALVSAYALYIKSNLQTLESALVSEADRINSVYFPCFCYYPDGFGPRATNINNAISAEREKASVLRATEPSTSVISPPRSGEDIYWLGQYLVFLSDSYWPMPTSGQKDPYSLGNGKFVPRDQANRGEEILRIMNVLGTCYLFPEPLNEMPRLHSVKPVRKIYFNNAKDVDSWLKDTSKFLDILNNLRLSQPFGSMSPFIDSLKKRDRVFIQRWETGRITRTFGRLEPSYLVAEFFRAADKVGEIAEVTQHRLTQYENVRKKGYPPQAIIVALLILCGAMFVCGVVGPLLVDRMPRYAYLHVPLVAYLLIYVGVLVWLCY